MYKIVEISYSTEAEAKKAVKRIAVKHPEAFLLQTPSRAWTVCLGIFATYEEAHEKSEWLNTQKLRTFISDKW